MTDGRMTAGANPASEHPHIHDELCGHAVVRHGEHLDFLHDGHLHHRVGDRIEVCAGCPEDIHEPHAGHMHVHGPGCGHETVIHGDHVDYVHGLHRHYPHEHHYDEH